MKRLLCWLFGHAWDIKDFESWERVANGRMAVGNEIHCKRCREVVQP